MTQVVADIRGRRVEELYGRDDKVKLFHLLAGAGTSEGGAGICENEGGMREVDKGGDGSTTNWRATSPTKALFEIQPRLWFVVHHVPRGG